MRFFRVDIEDLRIEGKSFFVVAIIKRSVSVLKYSGELARPIDCNRASHINGTLYHHFSGFFYRVLAATRLADKHASVFN